MEQLDHPPPPNQGRKMARLFLRATSSLTFFWVWGGGVAGFLFHVILSEIAILNIFYGTIRPPPPPQKKIKDEKWRVFPFDSLDFIIDFFGGGVVGGFLFHGISSEIVVLNQLFVCQNHLIAYRQRHQEEVI